MIFAKDLAVKYIILSCLFLSSIHIVAQTGAQILNETMLKHFSVPATPENILSARNSKGESILHILPLAAACAKDTSEVCEYAKAQEEISEEDKQKLLLILAQEGNPVEHHVVKIMQNHPEPKTIDNLAVFFAVTKFYKENKQPRESFACSWTKHPYRDTGFFIGGTILGLFLACTIGTTNSNE